MALVNIRFPKTIKPNPLIYMRIALHAVFSRSYFGDTYVIINPIIQTNIILVTSVTDL
jgi:hypothetical protein